MAKPNMSAERAAKLNSGSAGQDERHNECKNENYSNMNVVPERISLNVSFKSPGKMTCSILQDQLFEHMSAAGFTDFQRGERGRAACVNADLILRFWGCGRNLGPNKVINRRRSSTCIPTQNG